MIEKKKTKQNKNPKPETILSPLEMECARCSVAVAALPAGMLCPVRT